MNIIDEIEQEQMKEIREKRDVPEFNAGDTMKVHLKVCLLYTSPSPRD